MAGSVNKVILVGHLGKDPEVRYLESGVARVHFTIATTESYKDRNSGERISQTEWHNVVLWRKLAEVAEKYLKKGNAVYIEGKLRSRNWQDRDGNARYITEVMGDNMVLLDRNNKSQNEPTGMQVQNDQFPGSFRDQIPVTPSHLTRKTDEFNTGENTSDDLPF